jgi:hypothetical protein
MSEYFITIKNKNNCNAQNIRPFDDFRPMFEVKFQVQSRKNETKQNGNRSRIQLNTFYQIALEKRKNTTLQATSRTIKAEKMLARTSQQVIFYPLNK